MIFDSKQMKDLLKKYRKYDDFEVPGIVYLGRSHNLQGEREYIEGLVANAPIEEKKRKDWIERLRCKDERQHLGAWFEIMLYGWLRDIGPVLVSPDFEGTHPDFVLTLDSRQCIIEACAYVRNENERARERLECTVAKYVRQIPVSCIVYYEVEKASLGTRVKGGKLQHTVAGWLKHAVVGRTESDFSGLPDSPTNEQIQRIFAEQAEHGTPDPFTYDDGHGNIVRFELLQAISGLGHVATTSGWSDWLDRDMKRIKGRVREKARQHKLIRKGHYPYIIALFLEPVHLDADTVAHALLGRTAFIIDVEKKGIVGTRNDLSGLYYDRHGLHHTNVSGTLVFRSEPDKQLGRRVLKAYYIQNPYAVVPFDAGQLPVLSRFRMVAEDKSGCTMAWEK